MESAESREPDAGAWRRPKWYLLYYFLAALDVATVLASLTLNHRMVHMYADSLAVRQQWAGREAQYARLTELASAVNAPGNDVFDSRDVRAEAARLRLALSEFHAQFDASRREVAANVGGKQAAALLACFDELRQAMLEMVVEAELIFAHFEGGRAERAGERMATMDRKYASVGRALHRLFASVREIEHARLEQHVKAADLLKRVEYVIMGLAIFMIAGALFYGSRIYRAARAADRERARHVEALARASAVAQAASQAKSHFIAMVGHEIRAPLNTMVLTLDILEQPESSEEKHKCLVVARSAGRALKRLIDDLLDLSRIESGKIELACVRFELDALLHQLLSPYIKLAALKGVSLETRIAPEVPQSLVGDPLRLGQIVTNLVDNAVKFTDAGSVEVSISVRPPLERGDTVALRVAVRDTGIGVPPDLEEQIFEDFVQAKGAATRNCGGAGLGLGIVRRLVRLMNGEFGLEATPGGGATFWIDVELAAYGSEPAARWPQEARRSWEKTLTGRRVLLVEDSAESRAVTAAALGQLGLRVDVAVDGAEAVASAAGRRYDAILMDVGLPVMDGLEATRRIRRGERAGDKVPIIGFTAQSGHGIRDRCLAAGMDGYLAKPVTRESMVAALLRWLQPVGSLDAGSGQSA